MKAIDRDQAVDSCSSAPQSDLSDADALLDRGTGIDGGDGMTVGRFAVDVALSLWRLYVPDKAVDPARATTAMSDFLERQRATLVARRAALIDHLGEHQGASDGPFAQILDADLAIIAAASSKLPDRADVQRQDGHLASLDDLLTEWTSISALMQPERLRVAVDGSPGVSSPLSTLRASLRAASQRLRTGYAGVLDIIKLALAAVDLCTLALDLVHREAVARDDARARGAARVARDLVAFPSIAAAARIQTAAIASIGRPASASAFVVLRIAMLHERGAPLDRHLGHLLDAHLALYDLWIRDRQRHELDATAAASEYRVRPPRGDVGEDDADQEGAIESLLVGLRVAGAACAASIRLTRLRSRFRSRFPPSDHGRRSRHPRQRPRRYVRDRPGVADGARLVPTTSARHRRGPRAAGDPRVDRRDR